jgi:hypothetical protein
MKVFGSINIRRSLPDNPLHPRSLTLKGGCCDVDTCNTHDPENDPTEPPGYIRTTIPSGKFLSFTRVYFSSFLLEVASDPCQNMFSPQW